MHIVGQGSQQSLLKNCYFFYVATATAAVEKCLHGFAINRFGSCDGHNSSTAATIDLGDSR